MFRPKLDARSYMTLVLVVIAILLAINLVAQQPQSRTFATADAEATQAVAAAVQEVAASNQQIASSLQDVAKAITSAGTDISTALRESSGRGPAMPSSSMDTDSPGVTGRSGDMPVYQGTIEINQ